MKKTFLTIITIALFALPMLTLAEDFNINSILNEIISGEQNTSPSIVVKKFELNWHADTYTPFGYEGRALPVRAGKVFVDTDVAIINGDAKNLKYSWFIDDVFQKDKSGYGKTSLYFYVRQFPKSHHVVRVQVFNEDRSIFQEKSIEIPVAQPEIVLTRLNNKNLSIIAKPYFFSIDKLTDLMFEWTMAGQSPIKSSNYNASVLDINVSNKDSHKFLEKELRIYVENLTETTQNAYDLIKIKL